MNCKKTNSTLLASLAYTLAFALGLFSTNLIASSEIQKNKNIFVMLDGTDNTESSLTNVYKIFNQIPSDSNNIKIYIPGIGTTNNLAIGKLASEALGKDMEDKILKGYTFINEHYNLGDKIYIFGFSRGAHEARSLAGLISYAGILSHSAQEKYKARHENKILELVKSKSDSDYLEKWTHWTPDSPPMLESEIYNTLGLKVSQAQIEFLGLWDTVPGSSFKIYGECKEKEGRRAGDRYKSDSYPPIRNVFHAVAIDEKRSRFSPLLVCPAINPTYTRVEEMWFPGAHSDVGGGYNDSGLPNISLRWMLESLMEVYAFQSKPELPEGDPLGLAHWSIGDVRGNTGSDCIDRSPGLSRSPAEKARRDLSPARIMISGKEVKLNYPLLCKSKYSKEPQPATH